MPIFILIVLLAEEQTKRTMYIFKLPCLSNKNQFVGQFDKALHVNSVENNILISNRFRYMNKKIESDLCRRCNIDISTTPSEDYITSVIYIQEGL